MNTAIYYLSATFIILYIPSIQEKHSSDATEPV